MILIGHDIWCMCVGMVSKSPSEYNSEDHKRLGRVDACNIARCEFSLRDACCSSELLGKDAFEESVTARFISLVARADIG
jgi:hypothetical protein